VTPDNEGAIIAVVERDLWRSSRDFARKSGLTQPTVLDVICDKIQDPYIYRRSAHLISDCRLLRTLWLQQATDELFFNIHFLRTDNAYVQVSQQSHLSMGYSYAIRKRGCQVCFSVNFWADVVGNIPFRLYTVLSDQIPVGNVSWMLFPGMDGV
jgi:hypothetical protein